MKLETFFEKFDQLADAPNAVAKMRELVLQLAVRGQLIPQDPNDEPATTSVNIVNREARQAIRARIISQHGLADSLPHIGLSDLPPGWRWTRLAEVTRPVPFAIKRGPFGSSIRKDMFVPQGFKVYEQQHAISGDFTKGHYYVTEAKFKELQPFELHPNEVLVSCSGTVGKVAIVPHGIERGIINQALLKLSLHESALLNEYFVILFPAFFMKTETLTNLQGTAQKNIPGMEILRKLPFPLPPLAEQRRIVAKVDDMMTLYDQLESQLQERETRHAALACAAIARFTEVPTLENLNFLFHDSFTIEPADLRKTILGLAVQGKLISQDPNDEPAEECLSRLELRSTVGSLNGNHVEENSLPQSWARIRFDDVALVAGGVTLGRKLGKKKTVSLPYLRVANVKRGEIDLTVIKNISIAEDEIDRYALRENDLLMTEGGDWDKVGRAAIWTGEIPVCLHQNHVFRARMRSDEITPFWFERYFNSPNGRSYFESASKQTTNLASINMRQVRSCPIPFPPLAEQRRIIEKVDRLLALVDQLEEQLAASRATAKSLMNAVVAELIAEV